MARGGYRPGAGRPKGARSGKPASPKSTPTKRGQAAPKPPEPTGPVPPKGGQFSPLDYMLHVLNDPSAGAERRDKMAIAAAPYTHVRPSSAKPGKKELAQQAALEAAQGDDWGDDLATPVRAN
jgi:phage terminase small subunit